MIRGYFLGRPRPRSYVDLHVEFPDANSGALSIPFLIDTGADHTLLSPTEGVRLRQDLGIDLLSLPRGEPIGGVGGYLETRTIGAYMTIGGYTANVQISLAEPPTYGNLPEMPSLLGWDIIRNFAVFLEHHTNSVVLLEREDTELANFIDR